MTKICTKCKTEKPLSSFGKNKRRKDGIQAHCFECKREYAKIYFLRDPEKVRAHNRRWRAENLESHRAASRAWSAANKIYLRNYRRQKTYGVTPEKFEIMLAGQNYYCGICSSPYPYATGGKGWNTDHDHACCPGKKSCGKCVRGLLCFQCNILLSCCKDDISILEKSRDYLIRAKAATSLG